MVKRGTSLLAGVSSQLPPTFIQGRRVFGSIFAKPRARWMDKPTLEDRWEHVRTGRCRCSENWLVPASKKDIDLGSSIPLKIWHSYRTSASQPLEIPSRSRANDGENGNPTLRALPIKRNRPQSSITTCENINSTSYFSSK